MGLNYYNRNYYIFALMFGLCFLPMGDSLVTCLRDNFEQGHPVFVTNRCDPYRLMLIIKNYTSDDGIPAPSGSTMYLSNVQDDNLSHCSMSDSIIVKPGTRITVNFFGYGKENLAPTMCFLSAYNITNNAGMGADMQAFLNNKVWQNLTLVFNVSAEVGIMLACGPINRHKDEILAFDSIVVEMNSTEDCESAGIVTEPPPETTTSLPPTTTPKPEEPADCKSVTTTTTTTNTVTTTTVVTKTSIKSSNPESEYCPSKCC